MTHEPLPNPNPAPEGEELGDHTAGFQRTSDLPGGQLVGEGRPKELIDHLAGLLAEFVAEGENLDPHRDLWLIERQFCYPEIMEGLKQAEQKSGTPVKEFIRHSLRFDQALHTAGGILSGGRVVIPEGPENTHHDGTPRRHEEGRRVNLDRLRELGIDPAKVLFYRVTQPSQTPKPEPYWTSDPVEVRTGLDRELGKQASTAIILASTLETIAGDEGVMDDINDDQGLAVRRISLDAFDQQDALFSYQRQQ